MLRFTAQSKSPHPGAWAFGGTRSSFSSESRHVSRRTGLQPRARHHARRPSRDRDREAWRPDRAWAFLLAPPERTESGGGIDGGDKTAENVPETAAEKPPAKLVTALAFSSSTRPLLMTEAVAWLQIRHSTAAIPRLQGHETAGPAMPSTAPEGAGCCAYSAQPVTDRRTPRMRSASQR